MSRENRRVVLTNRPTGLVDENTLRTESEPVPEPADGERLKALNGLMREEREFPEFFRALKTL